MSAGWNPSQAKENDEAKKREANANAKRQRKAEDQDAVEADVMHADPLIYLSKISFCHEATSAKWRHTDSSVEPRERRSHAFANGFSAQIFPFGRAAESHFKSQLAHIKTSCCTKSVLKLWTASTGSTASQFAASQCGTWNKHFLLHKPKKQPKTKNQKRLEKKKKKKCCCFFGGIYTATKRSDSRSPPPTPPHILCCQGGWQYMRRCPPPTDTDQFLAGSRCLFPNMMTDCFNFPRHMAAMHQSQQQMAIKHLSH